MKLNFWQYLTRLLMLVLTPVSITLMSCGPGQPPIQPPPPSQNDGPSFVITSPQDDAQVSGPVFFSVQPLNPSEVSTVVFEAGETKLEPDNDGEDAFKVFLLPSDFDDGALELSATVTGNNGKTRKESITVTVVANPPSSATVDADGAVLGTTEENGSVSTLTIPPGAADGASVSFETRTKDQVKAETGIDYDALGVTFLGAQEITSTEPLSTPLGVSSGGFGPMVQPDQAVLNYMIAPDGDGDGIGELVAINTASTAPNGDVISDPVPQIQLGAATSTNASETQTLETLQTGTLSGPPGTFIELEATGFNQFSILGNVALFKSSVDGTEIELPAVVNNHYEDENPVPTIGFYIPVVPAGAATVTLKNVSTNETTPPISVTIETPPALTQEPAVVIDELFADAIASLSTEPEFEDSVSQLEEVRTQFAELGSNPTPEEAQALNDIAVFISNSNVDDLLNQIEAGSGDNLSVQQCSIGKIAFFSAVATFDVFVMSVATVLGVVAVFTANPLVAVVAGGLFVISTGALAVESALIVRELYKCLTPPPEFCLPPYTNDDLAPFLPRDIRAQQTSPPPMVTGMGSVVPPGGDSCGSAVGGDTAAGSGLQRRGLQNQSTGLGDLFGDLAGRFIVKVFFGGSNVVPFTGVSDSSGYFYIPLIPAGQPFEAVAIDTLTNETRSFEGTGPEVGQSTYMFFDFLSEGESGATVIQYDTNTQGVHDGVDIYFFEGKTGDVINLAVFSEEGHGDGISSQLSDPNGRTMRSSLVSGGGHYFETGLLPEIELELDGLYTFTLDGSEASGNYTLGLTKIEPPTPIDVTAPIVAELTTLGERQFYSFAGKVDDAVDLTLSHDAGSSLNVELLMREPLATVPFFKQPVRLRLETTDTRRSSSLSPSTLAVDGDYVLEVGHDNPFDELLQNYLGSYQIDLSITP